MPQTSPKSLCGGVWVVDKPNLVKCFGPRLRLWTWTLDFVSGPSFSIFCQQLKYLRILLSSLCPQVLLSVLNNEGIFLSLSVLGEKSGSDYIALDFVWGHNHQNCKCAY